MERGAAGSEAEAAAVVAGLIQRGRDHYQGLNGASSNPEEAARFFRLAADRGHADAQVLLGCLYMDGSGVEQSFEEAARLFSLAANSGNAPAQNALGDLYEEGKGVEQSFEEAARLFRLSADSGNGDAQVNLGILYKNGQGVEQSFTAAARLYTLAARNGNRVAMINLAGLYTDGLGVEKDVARAKHLLRQVEEVEEGTSVLDGGVLRDLREATQSDLAFIKETCASCSAKGEQMKVCVQCKGPRYCGRECQRADWPHHKRVCRSKAETAAMLRDANDSQ